MKPHLLLQTSFFFFTLLHLTSCITPGNGNTTAEPLATIDSSAQISEYIVSAFEDNKGNLWFGTMSDGVARYEPSAAPGKSLTYTSTGEGLVNNTVTSTIQDTAGNYWFGTHAGASRYNGKVYTSFGVKEGLHGGACKFLVDKKGTLWAATYDGVFRFTGNAFEEFVLPNPEVDAVVYNIRVGAVWRIMQDSKGNIWFGRDSYGACKYDPSAPVATAFTHYTKKDGLCSNNVSRIEEDKQGNFWFGCLSTDFPQSAIEGGVCRLDAGGSKIIQFPETAGLNKNSIYGIYCDNSGKVWISAGGVGVYRYANSTFTLFKETDRPDLIAKFYVQSFLEDSKGNLWFGFSGGLFQFNGSSFVHVTKARLLN
jgi:ligand-binding sensor domain-containing protein